jgi:predicted PurR-regulated permease PerM
MVNHSAGERYRTIERILSASLAIAFLATLWFILRPFFTPLLWSIILTSTTWPVYSHLRTRLPKQPLVAPIAATLILGIILIVVVVPLPLQLALEVKDLSERLRVIDVAIVREGVHSLPIVGTLLAQALDSLLQESTTLADLLAAHQTAVLSFAKGVAQGLFTTLAGIIGALIGCFILFRHGETLASQFRGILTRIGGASTAALIDTVHLTVRGAAYSVLATAVAQGALAGIGYYISGAPLPLLLGVVTMLFSLVPFGPPFMYIPVALYLVFFSGLPWYHGGGLAVWGTVVVSTIDNVLRPLFISHTTKLSAILVFIGVLGGVASFGLLGVFVGPAIVAVAQWLWLELAAPVPLQGKTLNGHPPADI